MTILLDIMKDGVENELSESFFLKNLYTFCIKSKKIPNENQLPLLVLKDYALQETVEYIHSSNRYKDYSFIRLLLKGIRKYPSIKDSFFSLSFNDGRHTCSSIFLGSNGVGKSSLYSALERIGAGNMSSAEFRGHINENEQVEYLRHANTSNEKCIIRLESKSDIISCNLSETRKPIAFPAFFCMESDVVSLSKNLDASYISRQLGLEDFYILVSNFQKLKEEREKQESSYNEDLNQLHKLEFELCILEIFRRLKEKERQTIIHAINIIQEKNVPSNEDALRMSIFENYKQVLSLLSSYNHVEVSQCLQRLFEPEIIPYSNFPKTYQEWTSSNHNIKEQLSLFSRVLSTIRTIIQDNKIAEPDQEGHTHFNLEKIDISIYRTADSIQSALSELQQRESQVPLLKLKGEEYVDFNKVYGYLLNRYSKIIDDIISQLQLTFRHLMQPYFGNDIRKFIFERSNKGLSLSIKIEGILPKKGILAEKLFDPRSYLNTFRFKIYCVALKVSFAFTCMRLYNINFPIVIDDVFDSSDFSNREKIQSFIGHLWSCHSKLRYRGDLQLIFFTQDDIIADSVFRGIRDSSLANRVKYARIFNYYEADDSDVSIEVIDGIDTNIINIEQSINYPL